MKVILINVRLTSLNGAVKGAHRLAVAFSSFSYSFILNWKLILHNMPAWAMFLFTCVYSCQVVYCVNRQIKISEEMALPPLTLPPPRLYLSSCPPSDFSPSDPHLLLWSKRKQTGTPRAHCKPLRECCSYAFKRAAHSSQALIALTYFPDFCPRLRPEDLFGALHMWMNHCTVMESTWNINKLFITDSHSLLSCRATCTPVLG